MHDVVRRGPLDRGIDYRNCSYSEDPAGLNLLGEGLTFESRISKISVARPPTGPPPQAPPYAGPTGERAQWKWYDPPVVRSPN